MWIVPLTVNMIMPWQSGNILLNMIMESLIFTLRLQQYPLREEELELMATMRPGLIQLEIGVQSTNLQTLEAIHRKTDFSRICQIVERIHSFGNIHQHLDLIAGLPYEDYDSFHHSFNDVYALRPQQFQLGFLKVLKGSLMKQMEKEYGIVHKEKEPYEVLSTNWITYEDVLNLKKVENMVEVYYNSGQFENSLKYVETLFPDSFTMYEALGRFYEQKGYECISHNRLRRYEILLEFIESLKQGDVQKGADALVLDLYLREKLKSRPILCKRPESRGEKDMGIPKTGKYSKDSSYPGVLGWKGSFV